MMAHKEELGQLMTLEQGKPLKEAIGEVPGSVWYYDPCYLFIVFLAFMNMHFTG